MNANTTPHFELLPSGGVKKLEDAHARSPKDRRVLQLRAVEDDDGEQHPDQMRIELGHASVEDIINLPTGVQQTHLLFFTMMECISIAETLRHRSNHQRWVKKPQRATLPNRIARGGYLARGRIAPTCAHERAEPDVSREQVRVH